MKPKRKTKPKANEASDVPVPNTGNEEVPPGARGRAFRRPESDEHGPGEGAGPRHATNDRGAPDEEYGAVDSNDPLAEPPAEQQPDPPEEIETTAYAGRHGGAIGGTPANKRAKEGHQQP